MKYIGQKKFSERIQNCYCTITSNARQRVKIRLFNIGISAPKACLPTSGIGLLEFCRSTHFSVRVECDFLMYRKHTGPHLHFSPNGTNGPRPPNHWPPTVKPNVPPKTLTTKSLCQTLSCKSSVYLCSNPKAFQGVRRVWMSSFQDGLYIPHLPCGKLDFSKLLRM